MIVIISIAAAMIVWSVAMVLYSFILEAQRSYNEIREHASLKYSKIPMAFITTGAIGVGLLVYGMNMHTTGLS